LTSVLYLDVPQIPTDLPQSLLSVMQTGTISTHGKSHAGRQYFGNCLPLGTG
jgi:hypothetical protein